MRFLFLIRIGEYQKIWIPAAAVERPQSLRLGLRTQIIRGNGVATTYGYDPVGRLLSLAHVLPGPVVTQSVNLTYSAAGQIVSRVGSNAAYDWPGPVAGSRAYTVNSQNAVTMSGGAVFAYDGRGNLASDSVNTYTYDEDNHLNAFNGSAAMTTDPVGRLTAVTDLAGGVPAAGSRWFRYGGQSLLAEYGVVGAEAGVLYQRYVPGPGVDETVVAYAGSGTTNRSWLLADERGSTIALTDVNGTVSNTNSYDEYGVPAPSNAGRFQYTGQMWIKEVGFYHYKARDYSPTPGRFLQADPVGYGAGMNLYAYVAADPLNLIDPSGLDGEGVGAGPDDGLTASTVSPEVSPAVVFGRAAGPSRGDTLSGQAAVDYVNSVTDSVGTTITQAGNGDIVVTAPRKHDNEAFPRAIDNVGYARDAVFGAFGASFRINGAVQAAEQLEFFGRFGGLLLIGASQGYGAFHDLASGASWQRTVIVRGVQTVSGIGAGATGAETGFLLGEVIFPAGGGVPGAILGGLLGAAGGDYAGCGYGQILAGASGFSH